jgi:hypothetical protein
MTIRAHEMNKVGHLERNSRIGRLWLSGLGEVSVTSEGGFRTWRAVLNEQADRF